MYVDPEKTQAYSIYTLIIICFAAAIISTFQFIQNDQYVGNDSTQYLVGAESLRNGEGFSTRILFFDEHYTSGEVPAPQTVWPPGLSILIVAFDLVGVDMEDGARIISAIAYILLIAGVYFLVFALTNSIAISVLASVWQLLVVDMWRYSGGIGSDIIFTAISTWCILIYASAMKKSFKNEQSISIPYSTLALMSLVAGIGFCFRYTSVFLIAWIMLLIFIEFVRGIRSDPSSWLKQFFYSALAALPSLLCFIFLVARNLIISGSIKGGNTKVVYNSIIDLAVETVRSFVIVLTGVTKADFFDASFLLIIVGSLPLIFLVIGVAGVAIRFAKSVISRKFDTWQDFCCFMIVVFVAIYIAGLIIISSRSFASYGSRYLLSAMPLAIVVIVSLWRKYQWGLWIGIGALSISQFIYLQANLLPSSAPGVDHKSAYLETANWIAENTDRSDRVFAFGDSQRIGYHIKRPTLAVPIKHFTSETWDENRFKKLALQYDVKVLIASKNDSPEEYEEIANKLMMGEGIGWIQLSKSTDNTFIYTINEDP